MMPLEWYWELAEMSQPILSTKRLTELKTEGRSLRLLTVSCSFYRVRASSSCRQNSPAESDPTPSAIIHSSDRLVKFPHPSRQAVQSLAFATRDRAVESSVKHVLYNKGQRRAHCATLQAWGDHKRTQTLAVSLVFSSYSGCNS
ncbi:hypothetical protein FQA47_002305 [Oryzias melastigma]|uniref:Uncharacterized protein n=1 Tax=Oryzias melastigma TaxID=30732 RepID=A0A834C570_ORYME|nr:hypothetical protein FQA47_002305 [Oryzias melastigma]